MQDRPQVVVVDNGDNNTGCVGDAWRALTDAFQDFVSLCGAIAKGIGAAIAAVYRLVWAGLGMFWKYVLGPTILTLINVGGYFLDKILFGSPGLRQYLHDGILGESFPAAWREFVRTNAGWDIYSSMNPVVDNLFGVLGLGVGFANIFNHLLTSYCHNVYDFAHVLGKYGVFSEQQKADDKRNNVIKAIFGFFTLPLVVPTIIFTNACDGLFTIIKHFFISFGYNLRATFNLLGKWGILGKHLGFGDDRPLAVIILFGFFSSFLVLPLIAITNVFDVFCTFWYNFFLSYGRIVRSTFNLLGKYGVFGERTPYEDDRYLVTIIFYGLCSSFLVIPTIVVTNLVDIVCTFVRKFGSFLDQYVRPYIGSFFKNFGLSFYRNLRVVFNGLGNYGVLGPHRDYEDDRSAGIRWAFGFLSAPFVGIALLATNITDGFLTLGLNLYLSYYQNMRSLFNIVLGNYGVFGERRDYDKCDRDWPATIIFGALTSFLVVPSAILTNAADGLFTVIGQSWESFKHNFSYTFNILLREHGIMGPHNKYEDKRGWLAIIAYGFVSFPFVAAAAALTNALDCACTFIKNFSLSFYHNLRFLFNIVLGDYGVMGKRRGYEDDRWLPTRIAYGVFSALPVLACAAVTNAIDLVCGYFKNYKKTILEPALIGTGVAAIAISAVPGFMLRKVIKGFYNFSIRPFIDCANGRPFNGVRLLKGVANLFLLGAPSAVKKVFKACTGYTDRFGFPQHTNGGPAVKNYFSEVQNTFKEAINLAAKGQFPHVRDGKGSFRMVMRLFYGLRHTVEKVVKAFHDAYTEYAKSLQAANVKESDERYNMFHFFQAESGEFKRTDSRFRKELEKDEISILDNVETYLRPA